uniref:Si:ch211-133n4.11 n=1 Tax=Denticeps clupeoides TaxID=299321 RepID=A0AAY4DQF9_9TELE
MQMEVLETQIKNTSIQLSVLRNGTASPLHPAAGCDACAGGWKSHGGKCYYFSSRKLNWTQSRDTCVTLGGHLLIINDEQEQVSEIFVSSHTSESHWIGLNDLEAEGTWVWMDNRPLQEFWFERQYGENEPDNSVEESLFGEDCVCLGEDNIPTNVWFDVYCYKKKRFVCETLAAFLDI